MSDERVASGVTRYVKVTDSFVRWVAFRPRAGSRTRGTHITQWHRLLPND